VKPFFDYHHTVTFDETNLLGNVYFTNHLRWQGHCRELFLQEHAPGVMKELAGGLALATTRCACEYFAELYAFDRIVIRMRLDEVSGSRIRLRFDYLRLGESEEELVARGEQEVACLRREGDLSRLVAVPEALHTALDPYAAVLQSGG
jgi:enediyne biosynthesis thioesterase